LQCVIKPVRSASAILAALILASAVSTASADITGRSVTVANSWEEEDGTSNTAASEYVSLRSSGSLGLYRVQIEASGRATTIEEEFLSSDDELNRLYSAAISLYDADRGRSLVLGRQTVSPLTGAFILDGMSLAMGTGSFTFNTRWGHLANITGQEPGEDRALGFGVDYLIRNGMNLTLDYGRTYTSGSVLTELLAADWSYSWHRFTKAYFTLNYDMMSRTFHEALLGARLFFSDRLSAKFEYSQRTVLFDSDSIYSIFAVDAPQETAMTILLTPSSDLRYSLEFAREHYREGAGGRRYKIGANWAPGRHRLAGSLAQHKGFGGTLTEVLMSGSTPLTASVRVGAGGEVSNTSNDGDTDTMSYTSYAGTEWVPTDRARITARLEKSGDETSGDPGWAGRVSYSLRF